MGSVGNSLNLRKYLDKPITKIDMWYNKSLRLWELTPQSEEGYQLMESAYVYGKQNALRIQKEMEDELWRNK